MKYENRTKHLLQLSTSPQNLTLAGPLYHQPLSLTQNFHRTVLLYWEGWDISLILFPLSCESHRQFDYNLSNN